jgi:cyclic peptide transporter
MKELIAFFAARSFVPPARLAWMAVVAGISNAFILGLLNAGAANAARGGGRGMLLLMFFATGLVYVYAQRYLFVVTTVEAEKILHVYRMAQIERVRQCDLDAIERIGPARIFNALTRQPQIISTAAGPIILGVQSAITIAFSLLYLAWLSIPAVVLTVAILGIAILIYQSRMKRAEADLADAGAKENELFNSITDLLDGFKEIRLNLRRSADLSAFIGAISQRVLDVKTGVDLQLTELYLFSQIVFYGSAAALVFILPGIGLVQPEQLLKTTIVILFLMGPITSIAGSSSPVANAKAGTVVLLDLEKELEAASGGYREQSEPITFFEEITLRDVVYQHAVPGDGDGFQVGPITLSLKRGETLFISGGNGSGKSTLLRLITALYLPQAGRLLVDGRAIGADRRQDYQNLFATVFSDFHLFQHLFGLNDVDAAQIRQWMQLMEIDSKTGFHDGSFDTIKLSTGQRKRLALVVAALEDRPIYVLDEFAADQDPAFRRKFYDEILPVLHSRGKTVIAVTHDDRYLDRATRHVTMDEGRLVERGTGHA